MPGVPQSPVASPMPTPATAVASPMMLCHQNPMGLVGVPKGLPLLKNLECVSQQVEGLIRENDKLKNHVKLLEFQKENLCTLLKNNGIDANERGSYLPSDNSEKRQLEVEKQQLARQVQELMAEVAFLRAHNGTPNGCGVMGNTNKSSFFVDNNSCVTRDSTSRDTRVPSDQTQRRNRGFSNNTDLSGYAESHASSHQSQAAALWATKMIPISVVDKEDPDYYCDGTNREDDANSTAPTEALNDTRTSTLTVSTKKDSSDNTPVVEEKSPLTPGQKHRGGKKRSMEQKAFVGNSNRYFALGMLASGVTDSSDHHSSNTTPPTSQEEKVAVEDIANLEDFEDSSCPQQAVNLKLDTLLDEHINNSSPKVLPVKKVLQDKRGSNSSEASGAESNTSSGAKSSGDRSKSSGDRSNTSRQPSIPRPDRSPPAPPMHLRTQSTASLSQNTPAHGRTASVHNAPPGFEDEAADRITARATTFSNVATMNNSGKGQNYLVAGSAPSPTTLGNSPVGNPNSPPFQMINSKKDRTFSHDVFHAFSSKNNNSYNGSNGYAAYGQHQQMGHQQHQQRATTHSNSAGTTSSTIQLTEAQTEARDKILHHCMENNVEQRTMEWFLWEEFAPLWPSLSTKCEELTRRMTADHAFAGNTKGASGNSAVKNPSAWLTKFFNVLRKESPHLQHNVSADHHHRMLPRKDSMPHSASAQNRGGDSSNSPEHHAVQWGSFQQRTSSDNPYCHSADGAQGGYHHHAASSAPTTWGTASGRRNGGLV